MCATVNLSLDIYAFKTDSTIFSIVFKSGFHYNLLEYFKDVQ